MPYFGKITLQMHSHRSGRRVCAFCAQLIPFWFSRPEDTAFLMGRQQGRDHWSRKALQFDLRACDSCEFAASPIFRRQPASPCSMSRHACIARESPMRSKAHLNMIRSPFEEASCQVGPLDSPSKFSASDATSPFYQGGQSLSFDESDSVKLDELQSTVRFLNMSFSK